MNIDQSTNWRVKSPGKQAVRSCECDKISVIPAGNDCVADRAARKRWDMLNCATVSRRRPDFSPGCRVERNNAVLLGCKIDSVAVGCRTTGRRPLVFQTN